MNYFIGFLIISPLIGLLWILLCLLGKEIINGVKNGWTL